MRKGLGSIVAVAVLLSGCNYRRELLTVDPGAGATFAAVQQAVVGPRCLACHGGPSSPQGVDLSSYETILGGRWVVPGDRARSPFYDSIAKGRMPKGQGALSPALVELVGKWIDAGAPKDGTVVPEPPLTATYASIAKRIFVPRCVPCHDGKQHELDLRTYETLMNYDEGPLLAVEPGDPDASSLWMNISEGIMPPSGPKLSAEELNAVKRWIQDGAKKGGK